MLKYKYPNWNEVSSCVKAGFFRIGCESVVVATFPTTLPMAQTTIQTIHPFRWQLLERVLG